MPPKIRALLSLAVIFLAALIWYARDIIGLGASPTLLLGLAAGMCLAVWMFPEVKEKDRKSR